MIFRRSSTPGFHLSPALWDDAVDVLVPFVAFGLLLWNCIYNIKFPKGKQWITD